MNLRKRLLVTLTMVTLSPCVAEAQRASAPKLGVDGLVAFRPQGSLAVLAVATPHWRHVSTPSEALLGEFQYMPEYAAARARGQIFQVLAVDGTQELGDGDGRIAVVPWTFGPGCAGDGWNDEGWVPPGDTVTFLVSRTRATATEPGSLPVFDVLGWHQPYPVGALIPFWRRSRQGSPDWLSPEEFFHLLSLLPSELAFLADPEGAVAPALAWAERVDGRSSTFPVPEIRDRWDRFRGR